MSIYINVSWESDVPLRKSSSCRARLAATEKQRLFSQSALKTLVCFSGHMTDTWGEGRSSLILTEGNLSQLPDSLYQTIKLSLSDKCVYLVATTWVRLVLKRMIFKRRHPNAFLLGKAEVFSLFKSDFFTICMFIFVQESGQSSI